MGVKLSHGAYMSVPVRAYIAYVHIAVVFTYTEVWGILHVPNTYHMPIYGIMDALHSMLMYGVVPDVHVAFAQA